MTKRDSHDVTSSTYDVAIVGYGPVGATAANLLGQMGLKVVVIERDPDIYFRARAISTDEEVMRIWQQVGLSDRLNADMQPGAGANFVDADGVSIRRNCRPSTGATATRRSNSSISPPWTRCCARESTASRNVSTSCSSTSACALIQHPDYVELMLADLTTRRVQAHPRLLRDRRRRRVERRFAGNSVSVSAAAPSPSAGS